MSFNWIAFLDFSKGLQGKNDEAACRTVVSRSYYAAFHTSRIFLESHFSYQLPQKDIHKAVMVEMTQKEDLKISKMGRQLERLRRKRNEADYKDNASINSKTAEAAIVEAEGIINDLMAYR